MGKSTKETVKAKVKDIKRRVKTKLKGSCKRAKAVSAVAVVALFAGCATSDPASRQTYATYDIMFKFGDNSTNNTVKITLGDGALASADSKGSHETTTSSPSNKVEPDVNLKIPAKN